MKASLTYSSVCQKGLIVARANSLPARASRSRMVTIAANSTHTGGRRSMLPRFRRKVCLPRPPAARMIPNVKFAKFCVAMTITC